jgi:protein-S-isoprenylcysteine O-methyltransferase Ste14
MKRVERIGDWVFRHRDILPVPFVLLALVGLLFYHPEYFYSNKPVRYIFYALGIISIVKGELLRVWANGHAGFITHSRSRTIRAKALVTTGPYAVIRNPLYAGNFLIGLGFSFLTLTWWLIILYVAFFSIEYGLIILAEERFLKDTFPEEFEKYSSSVPRIIPRLGKLKFVDSGSFHFEYLYPERWTILNIIIAGIAIVVVHIIRNMH